jgi:hypothetical protein
VNHDARKAGAELSARLRVEVAGSGLDPLLQLSAVTAALVLLAIDLELDEGTLCDVVRDSTRALRAMRAADAIEFGTKVGKA